VSAELPLACSVRECGEALARRERSYACARGHSFDLARSGYLNLLQPQDRRSLAAGDPRAALEARARLFAAGVGRELVHALSTHLGGRAGSLAVELGSGAGDVLAAVREACGFTAIGLDLSTAAAELAARRFPALAWLVANADRRLPLLPASVDLVLSVNGRRNPEECARVLRPGGELVVVVPAPDDLVELREAVQGAGAAKERAAGVVAEHAAAFALRERAQVRVRERLARAQLLDLLAGTYRGERHSQAERVATLDSLEVTRASELLFFTPAPRRTA